jgi:hypothetical protein
MARWLEAHKEVRYHTSAGENGFLVITLDNAVYPG